MAVWRLIPPIAASGRTQMAIDCWLLAQHQQGHLPSVLRLYTWAPIAISLGYHQRRWPTHWNTLSWRGARVDLVRRPSGGRAVLHAGDLTYALITSTLKGSRSEVYQQACQFLLEGFAAVGVPLAFGQAGRGYIHNPSCFGTATGADLVWAAHPSQKLVGSAQYWSEGYLLQHGSMKLFPEPVLERLVFGEVEETSPLPENVAEAPLLAALVTAAERCFAAQFELLPLTLAEIEQATAVYSLAV